MENDSILKKIINSIKNLFKIIITLVSASIASLFGNEKKEINKKAKNNQDKKNNNINNKKKELSSDSNTTLPDEDNSKSNAHDTKLFTEDDLGLKKPEKLYKVYTKDNELKYLTLIPLLDLLLKEDLETIYKQEKFKLKTASSAELIKVDKIKERIYPAIIERSEKDILRNSKDIKEALHEKLIDDQIKNPLFPNHNLTTEKHQEKKEEEKISITRTNNSKVEEKVSLSNEITPETPQISISDEIKNIALVGATLTATAAVELLSPTTKKKSEVQEPSKDTNSSKENLEEEKALDFELKNNITPVQEERAEDKELEKLKEKIDSKEEKTIEELEKLKQQVEEKIEQVKEEKKKEEKQKKEQQEEKKKDDKKEDKQEEVIKDLVNDSLIIDVSLATNTILDDSKQELSKSDFEERDYDKIERQIDKMLEDISYTYLKYEKTLTSKQKEKLKKEEEKLRTAKENLYDQKERDIEEEQRHLDADILEVEKQGLQAELKKIHEENAREVSEEMLKKIDKLEGVTKEQVANMDKRILISRFRKANIALEMSSILALPFIRNKYFFAFTAGMIVDNHFNFINAFFRRRINKYEPADLEAIQRGQDALNSALDITYKNITELDYIEQQALSRYPELAYDPAYVSQITSLRSKLTKKYNKLMKKNETLEKYRIKTKKHIKRLIKRKQYKRNQEDENAA